MMKENSRMSADLSVQGGKVGVEDGVNYYVNQRVSDTERE